MKKLLLLLMMVLGANYASAQDGAQIKFEKMTYDFGTFSDKEPIVTGEFTFTNVGTTPLIINQAVASCGCTVPDYTKEPIMPGKSGIVKVTYNGTGRYPGKFKKSITLRTNATTEIVRLYIEGNMVESSTAK